MGLLSRFLRRTSHANRTRFVLACWFAVLMLYALWASYLNDGVEDSASYVLYLDLHRYLTPPLFMGCAIGHLIWPLYAKSEWWTWGPVACLMGCSIPTDIALLWWAGWEPLFSWHAGLFFPVGVVLGRLLWRQRYISPPERS